MSKLLNGGIVDLEEWFAQRQAILLKSGRYLGYVEDEPIMWLHQYDSFDLAEQETKARVLDRLTKNGCGDGLVLDLYSLEVLACYYHQQDPVMGRKLNVRQFPPPTDAEERARMAVLVLHHLAGSNVAFIWQTWSG